MKIKSSSAMLLISGVLLHSGYIFAGSVAPIVNPSGTAIAVTVNAGDVMENNAGVALNNLGTITTITNNGSIGGAISNNAIFNSGTIGTITNNGSMDGTSTAIAHDSGTITTLVNNGSITGSSSMGINVGTAAIDTLTNYGTIAGGGFSGVYISSTGVIDTLNNYGTISGGFGGIVNSGNIRVLNNAQNGLEYVNFLANMPSRYNIIINSPSSYGSINFNSISGSTTFGVSSLSTLTAKTYAQVLLGIGESNIVNINPSHKVSGTMGQYSWILQLESGSTDIWELVVSSLTPPGPSTANTQASMQNTAQVLQGTYTLQNSVLANSFAYDCTLFDKNNVCVSAGGRNTAVSATNGLNNTSALLIAAYRPHPNYRIGAYADQNLSVNNAGSTVSLGNNTPLVGLFGAWNERLDGTGTEVKVSAAYGQKNTAVTRGVVGTGATASEAGAGGSNLNSQGAQAVVKYGFGVAENVIVSPYAGIRYTQNNMGGYTEGSSSSVTAPLTYSALNTNATTALAGVGASYRFIPQATAFASAGVETDTNTTNGSYSATGVTGLTPINFNANPVKTRPTAMVGATYDVEKNQRIGVTGIYRQEPYQAVSSTAVMATYTVGL